MTLLAVLLALYTSAPTCDPPCAKGQTCAVTEYCDDQGCAESLECEGTPDDCQTNGCGDHEECRWKGGNQYVCQAKDCRAKPDWPGGGDSWRCSEWSSTKDDCCHEWRYGSEDP